MFGERVRTRWPVGAPSPAAVAAAWLRKQLEIQNSFTAWFHAQLESKKQFDCMVTGLTGSKKQVTWSGKQLES